MKRLIFAVMSAGMLLFASLGIAQIQAPPAVAANAASPGHELTAADAQAWLDGLFPYALKKNNLASAVVVVVKDGQILTSRGYGYADVAARKPVDPATTLFRPGSISKTFMWTGVMQMVEQGKLDLDQDVNKYLDFTIPPRDGKPITLRHLMTHTPGFEETAKNLFSENPKLQMSNEAWLKEWVPERVYPPGEVSAYSNYGAALAGYILQRVSGQSFDDYVEQHIYLPLGMKHATFRQPLPEQLKADMALGYAQASAPPRMFEIVNPAPAGSMSVSGEDMGRYMIAHLQDGRYGDAQILRAETARQMHDAEHYSVPGLLPIALGFYRMDRNGQKIIGHGGDTELFHSELALFMQQNVGIFVSIDGSGDGGLRKQLLDSFADRYFPAAPSNEPTLSTARAHGALLVGRYLNSRVSVSNFLSMLNLLSQPKILMDKEGVLITPDFKDLAGQPRHWHEVAPFVWRDVNGGSRLSAVMQGDKVRWLSFDDIAPVMVFMPVPAWQSAGWNLPLLFFALAVFLLTVLLWPVAALIRRRYRQPLVLSASARRWRRWSQIVAILYLLFVAGWLYVLGQMNDSIGNMGDGFDGTLRLVQAFGVLAVIGTLAVIANAVCAWRERGPVWRKLSSAALLVACLAGVWFTFSLHLLNLHLNY